MEAVRRASVPGLPSPNTCICSLSDAGELCALSRPPSPAGQWTSYWNALCLSSPIFKNGDRMSNPRHRIVTRFGK